MFVGRQAVCSMFVGTGSVADRCGSRFVGRQVVWQYVFGQTGSEGVCFWADR